MVSLNFGKLCKYNNALIIVIGALRVMRFQGFGVLKFKEFGFGDLEKTL